MTPVDLRTCKPGDKLRSKHGMILTYVGPSPYGDENYPHLVKYPDELFGNKSHGTRSHDGRLSIMRPLPTDHDIVEIISS